MFWKPTPSYCLPLFIPDFILRIWSNPDAVKWVLLCINSATLQKSEKSLDFTPWRLYLSKNGMILSVKSVNLLIWKSHASLLDLTVTLPQSKNLVKLCTIAISLECWVIVSINFTVSPNIVVLDL